MNEFRSSFTDDLSDASRLGPIVSLILLRRRGKEVAKDLPEKIEIPQAITIADAYEELRLKTLAEYDYAAAMIATSRLRMFCTHPSLVSKAVRRSST